jgi:hypothetical protein
VSVKLSERPLRGNRPHEQDISDEERQPRQSSERGSALGLSRAASRLI